MVSRSLNVDQIFEELMNFEDSEDGFESDDDSVADPDFEAEGNVGSDFDTDLENCNIHAEGKSNEYHSELEENQVVAKDTKPGSSRCTKPKNVVWKKKNIELNEHQLRFTGSEELPADIIDLETPIQFFLKIFPQELFLSIAEQTNTYIIQKYPSKNFHVSEIDIKQFIGIIYIMSFVHLPRVTKHWNHEIGTPFIKETMPANKFEKLRQFIHFNDNSRMPPRDHPKADRLYKIRPLLTKLNETCMRDIKYLFFATLVDLRTVLK